MARDTYAGNPLLKGAYQPLEYDKETIEEFLRCSKDPVHFARTYMQIMFIFLINYSIGNIMPWSTVNHN